MTAGERPSWRIDCATTQVVVASGSPDGRIDGLTTWQAGYRHGETLLPAIGRFLGEQNLRRSRLTGIVVGTGPGAFTGLRVGLATAKGLAHGLELPLVGISTAQALLAAAVARSPVGGPCAGPAPAGRPVGPDPRQARRDADAAAGRHRARAAAGRGPRRRSTSTGAPRTRPSSAAPSPGRGSAAALVRLGAARLAAGDVDDLGRPRARVRDPAARRAGRGRGGGMVARPPMILRIEPMTLADLPAVHAIELASFDAAVAARGVPQRPRVEPAGPVPRRPGRRRGGRPTAGCG